MGQGYKININMKKIIKVIRNGIVIYKELIAIEIKPNKSQVDRLVSQTIDKYKYNGAL